MLNIFKKEKKKDVATGTLEERKDEIKKEETTSTNMVNSFVGAVQHTTEKAGFLNSLNQYVFKVARTANKIEVRKDIEKNYNVKVEAVKILNMPSKTRKLGRTEGIKSGFKKAIVKLREGYKIAQSAK